MTDFSETDFSQITDRRGTDCEKWDAMQALYGVDPADGIAMWVADMDFAAAPPVLAQLEAMTRHGILGYPARGQHAEIVAGWMADRHGWQIEPGWITPVHGLVNGIGLCLAAFCPADAAVAVMAPVYHAFGRVVEAAGRRLAEWPLSIGSDGRYQMDLARWEAELQGDERVLILCSPHNPGGRVWTAGELAQLGAFCRRHDLLILSDEIHHDLVFAPHRHTVFPLADAGCSERLVMLTSASKAFNLAGAHLGHVIVEDEKLRRQFRSVCGGLGMSPSAFGLRLTEAAYGKGAGWLDQLLGVLDSNRQQLEARLSALPGVQVMPGEATYLAWVHFADTGLSEADLLERVERQARIAANHGRSFGLGGAGWLRFNFALPPAQLETALSRLEAAFADLQ